MDSLKLITALFENTPLSFVKAIPFDQVVFDPRAEYMCKFGCKNYNRKYSCPPQSNTLFQRIQSCGYKWAILFATTHAAPQGCTRYQFRHLNRLRELEMQRVCRQVNTELCYNGSKDILLSSGPCRACKECSLSMGMPCKKPHMRQVSMEAIGIDCQRTMNKAGFDFQMPNTSSINRCGCILTNNDDVAQIHLQKRESLQKHRIPTPDNANAMCIKLREQYPGLFEEIQVIEINNISSRSRICEDCPNKGRNFSCPPYSSQIPIENWKMAALWKWRSNKTKKFSYNVALRVVHSAFFSLGFYFSLSLRDCYCDECAKCTYSISSSPICASRKILAPSMQSQGIDPKTLGSDRLGLELL